MTFHLFYHTVPARSKSQVLPTLKGKAFNKGMVTRSRGSSWTTPEFACHTRYGPETIKWLSKTHSRLEPVFFFLLLDLDVWGQGRVLDVLILMP